MSDILFQIVAEKKREVKRLHEQFDLDTLRRVARPSTKNFYRALADARAQGEPFFIAEFKRKSPSEGWIDRDASVQERVCTYARAGARAISVLTDTPFFGGSYADLEQAAQALERRTATPGTGPLVLQKDFILDPIQICLARLHGADIILLIAAILPPERLQGLKDTAERLGMGVLVEVHDQAELEAIRHIDFPVLGINNRDLKTFRTALNRVNALARRAAGRFVIAESGIHDYRDFRVVRRADGFLIGTSLMRRTRDAGLRDAKDVSFAQVFRTDAPGYLFKACGIRSAGVLAAPEADFMGVNFSPLSKRRIDQRLLDQHPIPPNAVAVFYGNTPAEVREILTRYPFRRVQLYAGDTSPDFVRSLRQKVLLAARLQKPADLECLEEFAADVDLFILDGAAPGSGQRIDMAIPPEFPYPFLLAGGLNLSNLDALLPFDKCIGADIASGIETAGQVDAEKISALAKILAAGRRRSGVKF